MWGAVGPTANQRLAALAGPNAKQLVCLLALPGKRADPVAEAAALAALATSVAALVAVSLP